MTYKLEIAHPNDVVNHGWTTVCECEEFSVGDLSFPTFEVFDGLVVRCTDLKEDTIVYTGIYRRHGFVDVGYESDAWMKYRWFSGKHENYVYRWVYCEYATVMMNPLDRILTAEEMTSMLYDFCVEARQELGIVHQEIDKALDCVSRRVRYDEEKLHPTNKDEFMFHAVRLLCRFVKFSNRDSSWFCMSYLVETFAYRRINELTTMHEARLIEERRFADKIRERVPFYTVALRITQ